MKRPIGVIFTCIVLGCFAALQLLSAGLYAVLAIFFHHGIPATPDAPAPPTVPFMGAIMIASALFLAILAAWAILTIVGLVRLRNWARYSVLVIGACLAFLGLCSVFGMVIASASIAAAPANANLPSGTMHVIFLFIGLIYSAIAAIGVWWLIYFNLRSTKAFFLPLYAPATNQGDPNLAPEMWAGLPPPPPVHYHTPGRLSHVPTSIIVIAFLFLFGALSCLVIALLPIPAFLLGFILYRPWSALLYLVFAAASALIGIGLLRLDNRARLGVYAFTLLGLINFIALLTPWGMIRYDAYQQAIYTRMNLPRPILDTHLLFLLSFLFCLVFYGIQIYLLQRHRHAFISPRQNPLP